MDPRPTRPTPARTPALSAAPKRIPARAAILLLALGLGACAGAGPSTDEGDWDVLRGTADTEEVQRIGGTVRFLEVEGGVYVIRTDDTDYDPTNLPESYRVDGLAVEADVLVRGDVASIRMVGPVVEVVRIRRSPGGGADGVEGPG